MAEPSGEANEAVTMAKAAVVNAALQTTGGVARIRGQGGRGGVKDAVILAPAGVKVILPLAQHPSQGRRASSEGRTQPDSPSVADVPLALSAVSPAPPARLTSQTEARFLALSIPPPAPRNEEGLTFAEFMVKRAVDRMAAIQAQSIGQAQTKAQAPAQSQTGQL